MLSEKAQEVMNIINKVKQHPDIEKYIKEYEGERYLEMENILNGHTECNDKVFKKLLEELFYVLYDNLITLQGQSSSVYYELKNAGYGFKILEKDSFGPLISGYYDKDQDWTVAYG